MSLKEIIKKNLLFYFKESHKRIYVSEDCLCLVDYYLLSVLNELETKCVTYCVAGGYPSYLAGKTTIFNDIDIFVNFPLPTKANRIVYIKEFVLNLFKNDEHARLTQYCNYNALNFTYPSPESYDIKLIVSVTSCTSQVFQFIFVNEHYLYGLSREIFCFEILRGFDLELCKSGFYLRNRCLYFINYKVSTKKYLIDRELFKQEVRMEKYNLRDNVTLFSPNKLAILALEVVMRTVTKNINKEV
jgi:hypothetical protein